jgi:hypothetical protein
MDTVLLEKTGYRWYYLLHLVTIAAVDLGTLQLNSIV